MSARESIVALAPMIRKVISGLMAMLFFGEKLCELWSKVTRLSLLIDNS